jgi:hypothetical protein
VRAAAGSGVPALPSNVPVICENWYQWLEQAAHNQSIIFAQILRPHPDQCLQGFYQFDVCLNYHEFARKLANSIKFQYQICLKVPVITCLDSRGRKSRFYPHYLLWSCWPVAVSCQ